MDKLFGDLFGGAAGGDESQAGAAAYVYDGRVVERRPSEAQVTVMKSLLGQMGRQTVVDEEDEESVGASSDSVPSKSDEDGLYSTIGSRTKERPPDTDKNTDTDTESQKHNPDEIKVTVENGFAPSGTVGAKPGARPSVDISHAGRDIIMNLARAVTSQESDVASPPAATKMHALFQDATKDAKEVIEEEEADDADSRNADDFDADDAEGFGASEPDDSWDAFYVVHEEESNLKREARIQFFHKVFKVVAIVCTFVFILAGVLLTKMSVLLAAANIRPALTLHCTGYWRGTTSNTYFRCLTAAPNYTVYYDHESCLQPARSSDSEVHSGEYTTCPSHSIRWIWSLGLILLTPELFVFLRSVWTIAFKKEKRPALSTLYTVLLFECLQAFGVSLFAFRVLPRLPSIVHGLALMTGVAFVPSLSKLLSRPKQERHKPLHVALDVLAVVGQGSALVLWPLLFYMDGKEDVELTYTIPFSLLLMSLTFWFNYIDETNISRKRRFKNDPNLSRSIKFRTLAYRFKKKLAKFRPKIYVWVSLAKMIVIFGCMLAFNYSDIGFYELFDFSEKHQSCGANGLDVLDIYGAEFDWIKLWLFNVLMGSITYTCARTAAKVQIQQISYAVPLAIATPILVPVVLSMTTVWQGDPCFLSAVVPSHIFWNFPSSEVISTFTEDHLGVLYAWWLAQFWLTLHVWKPKSERLAKTSKLFILPLWNSLVLEQWLLYNRNRHDKGKASGDRILRRNTTGPGAPPVTSHPGMLDDEENMTPEQIRVHDQTPMVYICATMWHENEMEMMLMLKSIFKLDMDQCIRRNVQTHLGVTDPDFYNFEAHIFFDDAMDAHADDEHDYHVNQFVQLLVNTIDKGAAAIHGLDIVIPPPTKYPTPYGGRLEWTCPGGNKIIAHLKDKAKIRHKKRWSQVMYMYYFLGYRLWSREPNLRRRQDKADNTFLLALDGDVDFDPKAMLLLVDLLRKDPKVGAACGRIHPTGSGPMVWYQKFEYAMGHWMQKATEHVLGCVLCSPGCFSMFRGSALMDDNVMRMYTTTSTEAKHYVQYDQGEDRWLCTLMLQQGYRVEYSAASDAFTFAPEGFNEFYNQRRRWGPSTMANLMDLISSWGHTIRNNENISTIYMMYQAFLFCASLVGIGTIFLMIVGAVEVSLAGAINSWESFIINLIPVVGFIILCYVAKSETQLFVASILTVIYALIQMLVLVGVIIQISEEGTCSPNALFFFFVAGTFILAGILHPQEFFCLMHGFLYFLSIPSMYMLLMIYALTNLNVVSWGTREVKTTKTEKEEQEAKALEIAEKQAKKKGNAALSSLMKHINFSASKSHEEGFTIGVGDLFRCLCCPRPVDNPASAEFKAVQHELRDQKQLLQELKDEMRKMREADDENAQPESDQPIMHTTEDEDAEAVPLLSAVPEEVLELDDTVTAQDNLLKLQEELNAEIQEKKSEKQEKQTEDVEEFWIKDPVLREGSILPLPRAETDFFKGLIERYLKPLEKDAKREERVAMELKELRNTMSFAYFLLNAIFVVFIFSMQQNTDKVSIPWPCGQNLRLEPIGFMFLCIYGLIILIQVIGMLFHRAETFNHIVATTSLGGVGSRNDEMARMFVSDAMELTRNLGHLDSSSERSSIVSGITEFDPEDEPGRRKRIKNLTMYKIARHKKKSAQPKQTLDKRIGMGFERLLSHIGDDYGEETEEKAAERIFKKITKVKKVQSTTHKKSLAAIAKIRKQNEARFRTQSGSTLAPAAETVDETSYLRSRRFHFRKAPLNRMFPSEGQTNPAFEGEDPEPLAQSSRSVHFDRLQESGTSAQLEMQRLPNERRRRAAATDTEESESDWSDMDADSDQEPEADYPLTPAVVLNQNQSPFNFQPPGNSAVPPSTAEQTADERDTQT